MSAPEHPDSKRIIDAMVARLYYLQVNPEPWGSETRSMLWQVHCAARDARDYGALLKQFNRMLVLVDSVQDSRENEEGARNIITALTEMGPEMLVLGMAYLVKKKPHVAQTRAFVRWTVTPETKTLLGLMLPEHWGW